MRKTLAAALATASRRAMDAMTVGICDGRIATHAPSLVRRNRIRGAARPPPCPPSGPAALPPPPPPLPPRHALPLRPPSRPPPRRRGLLAPGWTRAVARRAAA